MSAAQLHELASEAAAEVGRNGSVVIVLPAPNPSDLDLDQGPDLVSGWIEALREEGLTGDAVCQLWSTAEAAIAAEEQRYETSKIFIGFPRELDSAAGVATILRASPTLIIEDGAVTPRHLRNHLRNSKVHGGGTYPRTIQANRRIEQIIPQRSREPAARIDAGPATATGASSTMPSGRRGSRWFRWLSNFLTGRISRDRSDDDDDSSFFEHREPPQADPPPQAVPAVSASIEIRVEEAAVVFEFFESTSAEAAAFADAAELIGYPPGVRRVNATRPQVLQQLLALGKSKGPFEKEDAGRKLLSDADDLRRWEVVDAITSLETDARLDCLVETTQQSLGKGNTFVFVRNNPAEIDYVNNRLEQESIGVIQEDMAGVIPTGALSRGPLRDMAVVITPGFLRGYEFPEDSTVICWNTPTPQMMKTLRARMESGQLVVFEAI